MPETKASQLAPDPTQVETGGPNPAPELMQQPPLAQVLLAQQGPPATPHGTQVPVVAEQAIGLRQAAWGGLSQQGWFARPHSQVPFAVQTPGVPAFGSLQPEPVATQRPPDAALASLEQHAPVVLHLFAAQQGLPVTPHGRQVGLKEFN